MIKNAFDNATKNLKIQIKRNEADRIIYLLSKYVHQSVTSEELNEISNNVTINELITKYGLTFDDIIDKLEQQKKNAEIHKAQEIIDIVTKSLNGSANFDERRKFMANKFIQKICIDQHKLSLKEIVYRLQRAIIAYDLKPSYQPLLDFALKPDTGYTPKYNPKHDYEIIFAERLVERLRKYLDKREDMILTNTDKSLIDYVWNKYNMTPNDLLKKIEQAISLNDYRPRNIPFNEFIFMDDMENIGGKFSTFNADLSKAVRDLDKAPNDKKETQKSKIRDMFDKLIPNRDNMVSQLILDWFLRLKKHPDLVTNAKEFDAANGIDAYTKLLNTLANDFCDDYHIPHYAVHVIVSNDPKDYHKDDELALHERSYTIPDSILKSMNSSDWDAVKKKPGTFPGAKKQSYIYINLARISANRKAKQDLFDSVISSFSHEMAHALDYLMSNMGALGYQVYDADTKTYTNTDYTEYRKSATEQNAYETSDFINEFLTSQNDRH